MADLACVYTLSTPGGTIRFNDGDLKTLDDLYWIANIAGLDGAPIRAQVDNAPQAHGGIVHTFWKGPRHVTMEGSILIQSVPWGGFCLVERNEMEDDLRVALESTVQSSGTLSWTPAGQSAHTLTVRNDIPVEFTPQEGYVITGFTFGLVSASSDWT